MVRETWLDASKGIAIFLVVLGHAIRGVNNSGIPLAEFWLKVEALIYAFHMPLFFAISGWFYAHMIAKKSFVAFSVGRIERILYPMIIWTYIFFSIKLLAGDYTNKSINLVEFPIIPIPGMLHFWFLWDLFILTLFFYPIRFALNNGKVPASVFAMAGIIVLGLRFLPLNAETAAWVGSAIYNAPFFLLGVVLGQTKSIARPGVSGLIICAGIFATVLVFWPSIVQSQFRAAGSFVLVICALLLISGLEKKCPDWLWKSFCTLGLASMSIYVAHTIFSAAFRETAFLFGVEDAVIHIVFGTIVGLVAPLALLSIAQNFGLARVLGLERSNGQMRSKSAKGH